jgi:HAMP domain-containing protein
VDLSKKITVEVKGESWRLKNTINTMVDQLDVVRRRSDSAWRAKSELKASSAVRLKCAVRRGRGGPHRPPLIQWPVTSRRRVRNIAAVTTAVANGDLSKKITVDVKGEILELKDTINTMVDQLRSFASEVTRVRAKSAPKESLAARPTCAVLPERGRTSPTTSIRWRPTSPRKCATSPP